MLHFDLLSSTSNSNFAFGNLSFILIIYNSLYNTLIFSQVKIKLPTQVTEKHHVFFTFQYMRASRPKVALEPDQTRENLRSLRHQVSDAVESTL